MAARKLCRETQIPSMALFFFFAEETTGIAPSRRIIEKNNIAVGNEVTVNWEGKLVPAEILALSGKYCVLKWKLFCGSINLISFY